MRGRDAGASGRDVMRGGGAFDLLAWRFGDGDSKRYVQSAWGRWIPAYAGMTWVGAGMTWVGYVQSAATWVQSMPINRMEPNPRKCCTGVFGCVILASSTEREESKDRKSGMGLDTSVKEAVVREYRTKDGDTGSAEVQIALLTTRISNLTNHLREHIHDESTRRGLMRLVGRRRRLLKYLSREDEGRYRSIVARLGLRG